MGIEFLPFLLIFAIGAALSDAARGYVDDAREAHKDLTGKWETRQRDKLDAKREKLAKRGYDVDELMKKPPSTTALRVGAGVGLAAHAGFLGLRGAWWGLVNGPKRVWKNRHAAEGEHIGYTPPPRRTAPDPEPAAEEVLDAEEVAEWPTEQDLADTLNRLRPAAGGEVRSPGRLTIVVTTRGEHTAAHIPGQAGILAHRTPDGTWHPGPANLCATCHPVTKTATPEPADTPPTREGNPMPDTTPTPMPTPAAPALPASTRPTARHVEILGYDGLISYLKSVETQATMDFDDATAARDRALVEQDDAFAALERAASDLATHEAAVASATTGRIDQVSLGMIQAITEPMVRRRDAAKAALEAAERRAYAAEERVAAAEAEQQAARNAITRLDMAQGGVARAHQEAPDGGMERSFALDGR